MVSPFLRLFLVFTCTISLYGQILVSCTILSRSTFLPIHACSSTLSVLVCCIHLCGLLFLSPQLTFAILLGLYNSSFYKVIRALFWAAINNGSLSLISSLFKSSNHSFFLLKHRYCCFISNFSFFFLFSSS